MIESIQFENFQVLQNATIKLRPFNILVGPNASGKSTVFRALEAVKNDAQLHVQTIRTAGLEGKEVKVGLNLRTESDTFKVVTIWGRQGHLHRLEEISSNAPPHQIINFFGQFKSSIRIYALEASKIAGRVNLQPNMELAGNGANLAGALDALRDTDEEAFDELKLQLRAWLPEYDNIIFETPGSGQRSFKLRQKFSKQAINSSDLSEGTLIALALLLIAHNPKPPELICLEEPDRGLHPRLLREVRDALYRLSYPEQFGLKRKPVQVIATTHSPYFLDLFKDTPEDVIVSEKHSDGTATFKSLADDSELRELIGNAPLGEVWYSGLLGGVPLAK